ncbi:MAG: crotonase/enoyl-CoA hydratase family protein [bacterium]
MTELVKLIHHPQGIAECVLSRPDKMNALSPELIDEIIRVGESLVNDSQVRAVIVRGEGRAFCAGIDLDSLLRMQSDEGKLVVSNLSERTHGDSNRFQRVAMVWRDIPVPVIAAIHGVAFGGGIQIAMGADIRLIAPDARMSVMEIKWGLIPDMAGMVLMRGLVREDIARELIFTGRIVDATEAVSIGLATRVVDDPLAVAMTMAGELCQKSPTALRAAKRLMGHWTIASDQDLLLAEADEQSRLLGAEHQIEAVTANLQKRVPVFKNNQ